MSASGVTIAPECTKMFEELKLGKKYKFIVYKLSDNYKEVVVEEASADKEWDTFRNHLISAKSAFKGKEGAGPRYAVYDFQYELGSGEGTRNKITFISWSPDEGALMMPKMTYASSKEALKRALSGLGADIQANDTDEIEYSSILEKITKGKA